MIIAEGQIAREMYVIKNGEVEVLQEKRSYRPEKILGRLGPQELFGERALLEAAKHRQSVRSVTAVDVLALSREDFGSFVKNFPVLQEHFQSRQPKIFNQKPDES